MAVEAFLPSFGIVTTTAVIDSINPCAIGVLILMISVLLSGKNDVRRTLLLGGSYIAAIFLTYLAAGFGLLYFLTNLPLAVTEYISIGVGTLIVFAGILEVKDYFWYGRGPSLTIPPQVTGKIHELTKNVTVPGVIILGCFVAAVELPCTGAPYLAIITLLSQYFDFTALLLLVYYNVVFVLPLVIILLLVAFGMKLHRVKKWKQDYRGFMRLLIGLMLIGMGWLLMAISNNMINLG